MLQPKEVKSIDLKDIFAIILKRKWLIVGPLVVISAMAYGGTFLLKPKYESTTIIWIDKPENASRELASIVGGNRPETRDEQQSRQLAMRAEITSQPYLYQLIQDLKLDDDPDITREAAKAREETPEYSLDQIKYNLLVDKLRKEIGVSFYGLDQVKITVTNTDPVLARDIASRLTEILDQEKTKYEMEKILDNQSFADVQLQKTEFYYKQAIDSLNAAQARLTKLQLPESIASETNRFNIVSWIDKIGLERDDYSRELNSLKQKLADFNLGKARLKYNDSIVELRTTIDQLVSTYANMMEKYTWDDQNVVNVNIRINNYTQYLEEAIKAAAADQYASYPANQLDMLQRCFVLEETLDIDNSKQKRLQQSLDEIADRVNSIPRLQSQITELQNKVADARKYRDAFRSEEATVGILSEQAKERTKYKVIEPAQVPLVPVWPNKRNIVIIGIAMGLVLGGAFVFLIEILDNSFKRVDDVESELDLPVIATIPKIEKLRR
jgi:uncharacterized protein involved in exopolysaccharide biosynthesis